VGSLTSYNYYGYTPSVPWVPTRDEVIEYVRKLIRPKPGDIVYDIGCGDGRVAIAIAEDNPYAIVKCVEVRSDLVEKARASAAERRVKVEVIEADFFKIGLNDADIIYMYLLTSVNQKLRPKFEEELHDGTIIVSLDFPIPGWNPVAIVELERSWQRTLYVYVKGVSDKSRYDEDAEKLLHEALKKLDFETVKQLGARVSLYLPRTSI
jgi:SAM-dependent methyltransferase